MTLRCACVTLLTYPQRMLRCVTRHASIHNKILDYKRIVLEVEHNKEKTPSNQDILNKITSELKINPELVKIKHIYSHYGISKSKIIVNVYNDINMLKRLEEIKKKPKVKKEKKQQAKQE